MEYSTDVLIIGAGPVGLALAVELGQRGVDLTIVDPLRSASDRRHPRARYLNLRSVEHLRRWGLSDQMRARSEFSRDWPSDVYFVTSPGGHELARVEDAFLSAPTDTELYPEPTIQILQWQVEEVLREHLASLPSVRTVFGSSVSGVTSDPDHPDATAVLAGGHAEGDRIHARYVVGCEGGRSIIRRGQGFQMEGSHHLAHCLQVIFRSDDFYEVSGLGPGLQYWVLNDGFAGFIQTVSPQNRFLLSVHKLEHSGRISDEAAVAVLRAALGDDITFEIEGFDPWQMRSEIATTYRRGQFFLVGDAARQHPTFGGHGMNVGLSDAVDLGWKLAAVVSGWAPDALLDTFTLERRPIGEAVLRVATDQFKLAPRDLVVPGLDDDGPDGAIARAAVTQRIAAEKKEQFRSLGLQLGYAYSHSPLVADEDAGAPDWAVNEYRPVATAGGIAPHALIDGQSLYDRFGLWYTALGIGAENAGGIAELVAAAEGAGIPAKAVIVDNGEQLRDRYPAGLAIVRPDQHLAWTGDTVPEDAVDLWRQVSGVLVAAPAVRA